MDLEFDVLGKALSVLSICGLNPKKDGVSATLLKICTVISVWLLFILNGLEISFNWNGIETLSSIDYFPTAFMNLSKMMFLATNKKQLNDLLKTLESFWDSNQFDQKTKKKHAKIHQLLYKYFKFLLIIYTCCIIFLCIFPLLNHNQIFSIYKFCNFENNFCYFSIYFWQIFLLYLHYCPIVIGFDAIFAGLVVRSYVGIDLIKISLQNRHPNLKAIIDQHNTILNFIRAMNDLFYGILLIQFWSSLGSLIVCLYMLTLNGIPPSFNSLSTYGLLYISLLFQLVNYSIGGTLISNQTFSVADSAFEVDWHRKGQTDFRKSLSLIILRSQKGERITIGKFSDLNLDYFLKIVKSSISIYALLRTLSRERESA